MKKQNRNIFEKATDDIMKTCIRAIDDLMEMEDENQEPDPKLLKLLSFIQSLASKANAEQNLLRCEQERLTLEKRLGELNELLKS